MDKQVFDNSKIAKLKLSLEEKNIFFDMVNKFPKGIYNIKKDSPFMDAINNGNVERAFKSLQELRWNRVALAIIHEIKSIVKLQNEEDKKTRIQNLEIYVSKQFVELKHSTIAKCPKCGDLIVFEDKVCPYCGTLVDE